MKDIVIFGAGGLGKEILELILQINAQCPTWKVSGFYDDTKDVGTLINGVKVLGGLNDLLCSDFENVAIGVGDLESRAALMQKISLVKSLPTLIHPSVNLPHENVKIGSGTIVTSHVFISVNVSIGDGVLINVGCSIGHDVEIGNFCTINPGARISGTVKMGDSVFVGVGAILNNNITITSGVKIGTGSVVLKSIDKKATFFGNPARIMIE
jgi:sugar O-acyltransferase (sialic acid O-acetyltransferase NeuD family)